MRRGIESFGMHQHTGVRITIRRARVECIAASIVESYALVLYTFSCILPTLHPANSKRTKRKKDFFQLTWSYAVGGKAKQKAEAKDE